MEDSTEEKPSEEGVKPYSEVWELINKQELSLAQQAHDTYNMRDAEWHYVQAEIFKRKNWIYEAKKQLEISLALAPSEEKYKAAYEEVCSMGEVAQPQDEPRLKGEKQMGGFWENCRDCSCECCAYASCGCLKEVLCECCSGG